MPDSTPNHTVVTPDEFRTLLSPNDVATRLRVNYWTVIREINRKHLRAIKVWPLLDVQESGS